MIVIECFHTTLLVPTRDRSLLVAANHRLGTGRYAIKPIMLLDGHDWLYILDESMVSECDVGKD